MENIVFGKLVTSGFFVFRAFGRTEEEVYKRVYNAYLSAGKKNNSLPEYESFEKFCDDVKIIHMNFGK